jgi:hypothetical protein
MRDIFELNQTSEYLQSTSKQSLAYYRSKVQTIIDKLLSYGALNSQRFVDTRPRHHHPQSTKSQSLANVSHDNDIITEYIGDEDGECLCPADVVKRSRGDLLISDSSDTGIESMVHNIVHKKKRISKGKNLMKTAEYLLEESTRSGALAIRPRGDQQFSKTMESTIDFVDSPQAQSAIKGIKRVPRTLRRVLHEILSSESDELDDLDKELTLKQLPAPDIYINDEAPNMSSSKPKTIVEGATALVPGSEEDADDENSDEEGDEAIESKE